MFGEIIGGVLGGLFGGDEQEQTGPQLDPRLARWVYGEDGNSGLIGDAAKMYQAQMAQGGLHPNQQAGLEYLRQLYTSPFAFSGYNKLGSLAQGIQDRYASKYGMPSGQQQPQQLPQQQVPQVQMQYPQQMQPSFYSEPMTPIRSVPVQALNPFGFVPLQQPPKPQQPVQLGPVVDLTDRFA